MTNNKKILLIIIVLAAFCFAGWLFTDIFVYMFIAIFLAILGSPLLAAGGTGATLTALLIKIVAAFIIVKLLDDFILQPIISGKSVNAHPLEIFVVILVAGKVGGIFGMIFAVPAYTLLRIIIREFFSQYYHEDEITSSE